MVISMKATCEHKDSEAVTKDGLCNACRIKEYRKNNIGSFRESRKTQYEKKKLSEPDYFNKKMRLWRINKLKKDPEWNARRQREFRKKYPEKYTYIMARYYFKKLTPEKRDELLTEVAHGQR